MEKNIYWTNQMMEEDEYSYYKVLTNFKENWWDVNYQFHELVKEIHKKGVNIKSCLVCNHNINGKYVVPEVLCSKNRGLIIPASTALSCREFEKILYH